MKLYNIKVRAAGSPLDESRQREVTAGEIRLLKQLHGDDAVIITAEVGSDPKRTEAQERSRLEQKYGERAVLRLFGPVQQSIAAEIDAPIIPDIATAPQEDAEQPAPEPEKPLPVVERGPAKPSGDELFA